MWNTSLFCRMVYLLRLRLSLLRLSLLRYVKIRLRQILYLLLLLLRQSKLHYRDLFLAMTLSQTAVVYWGKHCTRGGICRNLKKFLFSLIFPVKTRKKVGDEISWDFSNFSSCTGLYLREEQKFRFRRVLLPIFPYPGCAQNGSKILWQNLQLLSQT